MTQPRLPKDVRMCWLTAREGVDDDRKADMHLRAGLARVERAACQRPWGRVTVGASSAGDLRQGEGWRRIENSSDANP